jgi:hypothetical protein
MSKSNAKEDATKANKTILELLEEDDEFEVPSFCIYVLNYLIFIFYRNLKEHLGKT